MVLLPMQEEHPMTWSGNWMALSRLILLTCSAAASIRARGAHTMPGQRQWSTISLGAVALDYLIKYCVVGSGAALAGLVTFTIMTSRAGTVWRFDFSNKDTGSRKALQLGIVWVAYALCVGFTYESQIAAKGSFDPYTLLALAANGFASLADSLNVVTWRRRSHFMMAGCMLAFGIYTGAWPLMAKASIDLGACVYFEPLFGKDRRKRINETLKSIRVLRRTDPAAAAQAEMTSAST
jgi:hypothetical protein